MTFRSQESFQLILNNCKDKHNKWVPDMFLFAFYFEVCFFLKSLKTWVSILWVSHVQIIFWSRQYTSLKSYWLYRWRKASFCAIQTQQLTPMPCWTVDWFPKNDMNHDLSNFLHCQILGSLRREETTSNPTFAQPGAPNNTEFKSGYLRLCCVRSWKMYKN